MMDGGNLNVYLSVEIITFVISIVLIAQAFWRVYLAMQSSGPVQNLQNVAELQEMQHSNFPEKNESDFFANILDVSIVIIPVTVMIRMMKNVGSSAKMQLIIERWSAIPWDDDLIPIDDKQNAFFEGVSKMQENIDTASERKLVIFFTLLICMLRMLQQTSLHPRLGLITGTMGFAAGHLMHALVVAAAVMCSFAFIGSWCFGIYRQEFATFGAALASEITMFFNADPYEGWNSSFELIVFTLLLMFMITLLVLNFVLAIIVESYMQVRKEIEKNQIEQSFADDLYCLAKSLLNQSRWGWPSAAKLGAKLNVYVVKHTVSYVDLQRTGLFPNHASIVSFLEYYQQFDFLRPEKITKFGRKPRSLEESVGQEVEKRIAVMFGLELTSLRDMASRRSASVKPTVTASNGASRDSGALTQTTASARNLLLLSEFAQKASSASLLPPVTDHRHSVPREKSQRESERDRARERNKRRGMYQAPETVATSVSQRASLPTLPGCIMTEMNEIIEEDCDTITAFSDT